MAGRRAMHFLTFAVSISDPLWDFVKDGADEYFWPMDIALNNLKERTRVDTWCVQVLRSPKEAFAAAMQSWRERCEKCVCLQGDYIEK